MKNFTKAICSFALAACCLLQSTIYAQEKAGFDDLKNKVVEKNTPQSKTSVSDKSLWTVKSDGSVNLKLINQYDPPGYWTLWVWPEDLWLNCSSGAAGRFDRITAAYHVPSDKRMKKDIKDLPNVLDGILKLHARSYHFIYNKETDPRSFGFIAQEVKEVFPELVSNGVNPKTKEQQYLLNYDNFSVYAIKAIQEQQQQIDSLKFLNASLKNELRDIEKRLAKLEISDAQELSEKERNQNAIITSASLEQNIPNPFDQTTIINYTLPEQFSSAKIIITDKTGKILKEVNVSGSGKGSLKLDASMLSNGVYNYTLYVDRKLIAAKQMILK